MVCGKNGRLFLDHDANHVMLQHSGDLTFTAEQLNDWFELLARRANFFQQKNIKFCFLIAPDAQSVFYDELPFEPSLRRPIHDFMERMAPALTEVIHYPLDTLKALRSSNYTVYPKTDTHWSSYSCFKIYQSLQGIIDEEFLSDDEVYFDQINIVGDLGNKVVPERQSSFTVAKVKQQKSQLIFNNGMSVRGRCQIFRNSSAVENGKVCLLFGDSFSYDTLAFFKESYDTFVFCHSASIDYDLISLYKPNVVICEMAERFLLNIPSDNVEFNIAEVFRQKLLLNYSEVEGERIISNINEQASKLSFDEDMIFAHRFIKN
ncbi:alginate O-acetyltransferase AlgX-related protein [Neiella marina]|uniref:alginate O-acetyltransferase AlgX-related protein n=1 Tax=Neiella marina TaxID=508461 RepID=UPI001E4AFECE|nr:hypothetical protein [Neiella marina]